jgi:hypothetical protein
VKGLTLGGTRLTSLRSHGSKSLQSFLIATTRTTRWQQRLEGAETTRLASPGRCVICPTRTGINGLHRVCHECVPWRVHFSPCEHAIPLTGLLIIQCAQSGAQDCYEIGTSCYSRCRVTRTCVSIMHNGVRGLSQSIADVLTGTCSVVSDRARELRGEHGHHERDRDTATIAHHSPKGRGNTGIGAIQANE